MAASLLPLVPLPPLAACLLLALAPIALWPVTVRILGIGGCGLAALLMLLALRQPQPAVLPLAEVELGGARIALALSGDPLSLLAGATVATVAALVMVYAGAYMEDEAPGEQRRFFALMSLFLSGMLAVVLAADTVLLFLGWEVIGLCSFFLIAFYIGVPRAVAGGRKALVTTRVADAFLLAGFVLLFLRSGGTRFDAMLDAEGNWPLAPITALIAVGALGKSAQLPFQSWLPSAMTGPTPVSALLHSATMVAAGVILLARIAPLLAAVPEVALAVALVGGATALLAALAALVQGDIKRLLAWSTISQIGLMMLGLGAGAPDAAMAHFCVHAAFKSLLFLAAGVMTHAAGGDTAIAALRGARRRQPLAFWAFAAGAASLAGLPMVTAGWYSKEAVLAAAWAGGDWGVALWTVAAVTAATTGAYAMRVVLALAGPAPAGAPPHPWGGARVGVPLVLLAAAALGGGVVVEAMLGLLGGAHRDLPAGLIAAGAAAPLLGALYGLRLACRPARFDRLRRALKPFGAARLESLTDRLLVRNFRRLARALQSPGGLPGERRSPGDHADAPRLPPGPTGDRLGSGLVAAALAVAVRLVRAVAPDRFDLGWMRTGRALGDASTALRGLQTGRARDYALALTLGAALLLFLALATA